MADAGPGTWPGRLSAEGGGPVAGVGIANQRASSIVWERATGRPVAPGIGWQDLRTVGNVPSCCSPGRDPTGAQRLGHQGHGHSGRGGPRTLAGRAGAALLRDRGQLGGLDTIGRGRGRRGGAPCDRRHQRRCHRARRPRHPLGRGRCSRSCGSPCPCCRPSSIRPGPVGAAAALPGAPPICGIAGGSQQSLPRRTEAAPCRAWPRRPSAPGGMLDQCTSRIAHVRPHGPRRRRHLSHRGVPRRWGGHLGHRGGNALGRHRGRMAPKDDLGIIATAQESRRGGGPVRNLGRRLVRAGATRVGDAGLGFRSPRAWSGSPEEGSGTSRRSCGRCFRRGGTAALTWSRASE